MLPQLTDKLEGRVSEELCASAAYMANALHARAIFVYTRRGYMANFLSRCRPDCPIFAFTGLSSLCHPFLPVCVCCLLASTQHLKRQAWTSKAASQGQIAVRQAWVKTASSESGITDTRQHVCADKQDTRQRLNLRWGVMPFRMDLQADPDANVDRTFALLKRRDLVQTGDLVIVVSDIRQPNEGVVRSVQIRHVP